MGKRGKRKDQCPPFVMLPWEVLNSPAHKALPFSARSALPYFLGKPKCKLNSLTAFTTVFEFSYSEAQRHGFSRGTWSNVIRNLVAKGFVDPVEKGGLRGEGYSGNLFRLSHRWRDYGTSAFVSRTWEEFFSLKAS